MQDLRPFPELRAPSIMVLREEMIAGQGEPERGSDAAGGRPAITACPQCGLADRVVPAIEQLAGSSAPQPAVEEAYWNWVAFTRTAVCLSVGAIALYFYLAIVVATVWGVAPRHQSDTYGFMFLCVLFGVGLSMAAGLDLHRRAVKPGWERLSRVMVGLVSASGGFLLAFATLAGIASIAGPSNTNVDAATNAFFLGLTTYLGILLLGLAGTIWLKKRRAHSRRARKEEERIHRERQRALWGHLLYCGGCDGSFMPGATQGSIPGELLRTPSDPSPGSADASPASGSPRVSSRIWLGVRLGMVGLALAGGALHTRARTDHGAASAPGGDGATLLGKQAPVFVLPTAKGELTDLRSYRGKLVLVDIVESRCPYCQRELQTMDRINAALRRFGVRVVAVDVGESAATLRSNVSVNDLSFPIGLDTDSHVSDQYGVHLYVPVVFLVDRQGVVRAISDGTFDRDWVTSHVLPYLPSEAGRALVPTPTPLPPTPVPSITVRPGLVLTAPAQGVDPADEPRIRTPQSLFLGNDSFIWAATFVRALPRGAVVTIEIDRIWGGKVETTYHREHLLTASRSDIQFPGPGVGTPFGIRGAGAYTVRYLQGQTVLAEGHFTITT